MIEFQLFMLVAILFLAGKDATSYKLKSKIDDSLSYTRIKRFHRDGFILNLLFILPFIYFNYHDWHLYVVYTTLLRLIAFDLAFNYWAGLNPRFLGSTAWTDKQFIKIFGINGALKKSIVFTIVLILLNLI